MEREAQSRADLALADDFYLATHDPGSGGLLLHTRVVDLGVAASLLGELMLSGWVTVDNGLLSAVDRRPAAPEDLSSADPPRRALARTVWDQVVREPWRHPLRTWLTVLSQDGTAQVIDRLAAAGVLGAQRGRRPARAEPTKWHVAAWPVARLRNALEHQYALSWQDVLLLALINATGLHQVLNDLPGAAREYGTRLLASLTPHPALVDLVAQTTAATATVVLTRGRG